MARRCLGLRTSHKNELSAIRLSKAIVVMSRRVGAVFGTLICVVVGCASMSRSSAGELIGKYPLQAVDRRPLPAGVYGRVHIDSGSVFCLRMAGLTWSCTRGPA